MKWSTKYKKVPILIAELEDGQKYQLVDSSAIISAMYSFLYDKPKGGLAEVLTCYPQVRQIEEETDSKKPKFEIMNRYFLMFQESTPNKDKQKILQGKLHTVWKFSNFSAMQILREINVGKLAVLKNCNFDNFGDSAF